MRHRKLLPAAARYIRRCAEVRRTTPTARQLAERYGVSYATVQQIVRGTRYKGVP
jgi:transposase